MDVVSSPVTCHFYNIHIDCTTEFSTSDTKYVIQALFFAHFQITQGHLQKKLKPTFCRKINVMEATYDVAKKLKEFSKLL